MRPIFFTFDYFIANMDRRYKPISVDDRFYFI